MSTSERPVKPDGLWREHDMAGFLAYKAKLHDYLRAVDEGAPWLAGEAFARDYDDSTWDALPGPRDDPMFRIESTQLYFLAGLYAGRAGWTGEALEAFKVGLNGVYLQRIGDSDA